MFLKSMTSLIPLPLLPLYKCHSLLKCSFFFFLDRAKELFKIRNSIHLLYFKGAILFIYQWKKLEIIPLPKSGNGKQIPLKVTVTYRVHPRKRGETASTHLHEFHQRLDPLKGGEKRQLSKRSMLLIEAFLYSFLRAPDGGIFAKLDLGSGMWK